MSSIGHGEVSIHEDHVLTLRGKHPREHGGSFALMRFAQHVSPAFGDTFLRDGGGIILAAVVHDDHFHIEWLGTEISKYGIERTRQALRLVIRRNHDTDIGCGLPPQTLIASSPCIWVFALPWAAPNRAYSIM